MSKSVKWLIGILGIIVALFVIGSLKREVVHLAKYEICAICGDTTLVYDRLKVNMFEFVPPPASPTFVMCPKCGAEIIEAKKFYIVACPNCGRFLSYKSSKYKLPRERLVSKLKLGEELLFLGGDRSKSVWGEIKSAKAKCYYCRSIDNLSRQIASLEDRRSYWADRCHLDPECEKILDAWGKVTLYYYSGGLAESYQNYLEGKAYLSRYPAYTIYYCVEKEREIDKARRNVDFLDNKISNLEDRIHKVRKKTEEAKHKMWHKIIEEGDIYKIVGLTLTDMQKIW